MTESKKQGRRVAVVGSGLAGLATSYMLQKSGYTVELFEQENSIGMDAGSLTIDGVRIDVPFRVFTPDYYPYLYSLYTHLGIEFAAADYSLGFTGDKGESIWSYTNATIGDFQMPIPDSVYKTDRTRVTRDWLRLVFACVRVMRTPRVLLPGGRLDQLTIGEYLVKEQYGGVFIEHVFLPFIASLLTCSLRAAREYPATTILHFVAKAVCGARLRKARHGVQHVCHVLAHGLCVHLGTRVDAITTSDQEHVKVVTRDKDHWFDDIVLATPADVSARLLQTSGEHSSELVDALTSVSYEDAVVVTHRDERVMPSHHTEWRGVNIRTHRGDGHVMASHWINHVERTSNGRSLPTQVFQTVDPLLKLDSTKIIGSTHFRRSLVTRDSQSRINTIHKHQGLHNVWFVGSYTSPGVPLLEGCVRTAVDVVRAMHGRVPFDAPRMERSGYEVGLGERMVRGEVVEAFFECDGARTFECSQWPKHGRQWLAWLAFGVLPVVALVVDAVDAVLSVVLGRDIACRVQFVIMDVLVYVVCLAQMAYSRIMAL
ncbi:hypothetical protein IW148_003897 [Coemansia sp. RSA 1199]|nr:hypothetical protein IW148_003897 [Coemansia sp. RSA 1199]